MPRAMPPLTWFRAFEAAARHLNFTLAAQEIGLTQSAVSQQVRSLELRLGVELFLRKPRGLALTDDGRKLMPKVGAALGSLAQAVEGFETGRASNLLTIATSVSVAQWIIAPRLHAFLATQPGLRVRVLSTLWPDDFKAALADVEIRFGSEAQVGTGATRLRPDGLIAVCAPSLHGDWQDRPLIEAVGTSDGWKDWAQAAGEPHLPEPSIYVDSYGMALDLAVQGNGVALTSSYLAAGQLARGSVVQIAEHQIENRDGYFLAINQAAPHAVAFGDWLQSV